MNRINFYGRNSTPRSLRKMNRILTISTRNRFEREGGNPCLAERFGKEGRKESFTHPRIGSCNEDAFHSGSTFRRARRRASTIISSSLAVVQ